MSVSIALAGQIVETSVPVTTSTAVTFTLAPKRMNSKMISRFWPGAIGPLRRAPDVEARPGRIQSGDQPVNAGIVVIG